jgi:hypothetical protein
LFEPFKDEPGEPGWTVDRRTVTAHVVWLDGTGRQREQVQTDERAALDLAEAIRQDEHSRLIGCKVRTECRAHDGAGRVRVQQRSRSMISLYAEPMDSGP